MAIKMKTLRIILSLILATTIFACEDKNIFPDPMTLPVKALDLNVEIMDIFSLPDDRAAAFVKLDKQSTDTKDAYQLAIIDKHGNYTLSDVMYVFSLDEEQFADKQIYISSSGDICVKFQVREIAASNIVKLNKEGHIISDARLTIYIPIICTQCMTMEKLRLCGQIFLILMTKSVFIITWISLTIKVISKISFIV